MCATRWNLEDVNEDLIVNATKGCGRPLTLALILLHTYTHIKTYSKTRESSTTASMARDDSPAARRAARRPPAARRPQCAVKWDRNFKPKLAIMCQCTPVTCKGVKPDNTRAQFYSGHHGE